MPLVTWFRWYLPGFLNTVKFFFSPFYTLWKFFLCFLEVGSLRQVYIQEEGIKHHLLERGVSTYIIWNSVQKICPFSPIYLFSHICLSVGTHRYVFYSLGYSPVLLNCSNFTLWELFQVNSSVSLTCLLFPFSGIIVLARSCCINQ